MNRFVLILILILILIPGLPAWLLAQPEPAYWLRYTQISPDGQHIAFSCNGDIYTVAASGGRALRLTSHTAYEAWPVWSRDGKTLAFASERFGNFDVFSMPAAGGYAQRLTFHSAHDYPTDFSKEGERVWFNSTRLDPPGSLVFYRWGELYSVALSGGLPTQHLAFPAWEARENAQGDLLFEEIKGGEDEFRKHHTSSVARDIWLKRAQDTTFQRLTSFEGEDRDAVFGQGDAYYYLSERSGSFNVFQGSLSDPSFREQVSNFSLHPVRYLSISDDGLLCYSYNGQIYTQRPEEAPARVAVQLNADANILPREVLEVSGNVREMVYSPNDKELFFVYRGEIFVTAIDGSMTRRLTHTPQQERHIDLSPDGRTLVFAGERANGWDLYTLSLEDEDEDYFLTAKELKEEVLLRNEFETFQPKFSPDGAAIAFLESRIRLKTIQLDTKAITLLHDGSQLFSYADGDQHFSWSPDGKWLALTFLPKEYWVGEVGIIPADGGAPIRNLSQSGFSDETPKWSPDGKMLFWGSNREGMHSVARTGSYEEDVYALFLTQEAYDQFQLSKEERAFQPEAPDPDSTDESADDSEEEEPPLPEVNIEFEGIQYRKAKLSLFSSRLSDALITPDGKHLLTLGRVDDKAQLWKTELASKETKSLGTFRAGGSLQFDKEGKHVFVLSGGRISKVNIDSGKTSSVSISGEMQVEPPAERMYLFDHVARQVKKKFLDPELHGVDWDMYTANYRKFVPYLTNNHDFRDVLSELLGELNASHTGARFRPSHAKGDQTAALGAFFDPDYEGVGLKIVEIMPGSPLIQGEGALAAGTLIESIDGTTIDPGMNHHPLLNRKVGKPVLLGMYNPQTEQRWKSWVKPISQSAQDQLRYERWIEQNRALVHRLSDSTIGYMHVRSMSDGSFRAFLDKALGEEVNKQALIVDTRYNGGGDLVDDLTTWLSGTRYMTFKDQVEERIIGFESQRRWTKPSVMLIAEGNYSDAHCTPAAYKDLEIGKLIGMPVPGTCSFVWWERLQNGMVFGIPNLAVTDKSGAVLENKQLEPDIQVKNEFQHITRGHDQQIAAAVEELMRQLKADKN